MNETDKTWRTSRRSIDYGRRTLVMGIVNVTPDSFSDGGTAFDVDDAIKLAEKHVMDGADILDIGGESTRPGSSRVGADEEIRRVVPAIDAIRRRFDVPISIDTSKSSVAEAAADAGAEIINDISGLRFDERIAEVTARFGTGLILMHSRGEFGSMHLHEPVADILGDVSNDFRRSLSVAAEYGVNEEQIVLDVGIGFSKTLDQNLELIANLGKIAQAFPQFPLLVGASRKSFIGKILGETPATQRLSGSLAAASIAAWNGAAIVRVHDVKESVESLRVVDALRDAVSKS